MSMTARLPELLHGQDTRVWADAAYSGQRKVIQYHAPQGLSVSFRPKPIVIGPSVRTSGHGTGRNRKSGRKLNMRSWSSNGSLGGPKSGTGG
ncbi:hypothetical protein COMA2_210073 [Candidatus Nitrospira nitrificans]|uniref:Uncharacterized protein n=1 Tax=Candidatus Nitrospira nitrificans TaxID=1742973 RepID=A0A0S4LGB9_9BACT|nr:hypothetical protein COMA2_210073 [Candidatus Nitrospira nitrificans]